MLKIVRILILQLVIEHEHNVPTIPEPESKNELVNEPAQSNNAPVNESAPSVNEPAPRRSNRPKKAPTYLQQYHCSHMTTDA